MGEAVITYSLRIWRELEISFNLCNPSTGVSLCVHEMNLYLSHEVNELKSEQIHVWMSHTHCFVIPSWKLILWESLHVRFRGMSLVYIFHICHMLWILHAEGGVYLRTQYPAVWDHRLQTLLSDHWGGPVEAFQTATLLWMKRSPLFSGHTPGNISA